MPWATDISYQIVRIFVFVLPLLMLLHEYISVNGNPTRWRLQLFIYAFDHTLRTLHYRRIITQIDRTNTALSLKRDAEW